MMSISLPWICDKCEQPVEQNLIPSALLYFVNPTGWADEAERTAAVACNDCQLSTPVGAIQAILAVSYAPDELFTAELFQELLAELALADMLGPEAADGAVWPNLVRAAFRWRHRIRLADVAEMLAWNVGEEAAASFLRRLADHAYTESREDLLRRRVELRQDAVGRAVEGVLLAMVRRSRTAEDVEAVYLQLDTEQNAAARDANAALPEVQVGSPATWFPGIEYSECGEESVESSVQDEVEEWSDASSVS